MTPRLFGRGLGWCCSPEKAFDYNVSKTVKLKDLKHLFSSPWVWLAPQHVSKLSYLAFVSPGARSRNGVIGVGMWVSERFYP